MIDEPTNRELKMMIDSHNETSNERHETVMGVLIEIKKDVKETKDQAIKTNGRVSRLEFWKSVLIWSFGVVIALAVPLMGIIKTQIKATVISVLGEYNITIEDEK